MRLNVDVSGLTAEDIALSKSHPQIHLGGFGPARAVLLFGDDKESAAALERLAAVCTELAQRVRIAIGDLGDGETGGGRPEGEAGR